MIEGFVTTYTDDEGWVHLFFFPGIDESDNVIYNDIDLSHCKVKYQENLFNDGSLDVRFFNKNIIRISCTLVKRDGTKDFRILRI